MASPSVGRLNPDLIVYERWILSVNSVEKLVLGFRFGYQTAQTSDTLSAWMLKCE